MLVSEPSEAGVNESTKDDPRPDLSLIAALNNGDAAAFDVLYYRHRDWVANLAFRYTRSHDLSLDVLQETFLYLVKKFPRFTLSCQLRSFLYPVVKNLSLTALRKARRHASLEESLESGVAEPSIEPDIDVADDDLAGALAGLSAEHREVLMLRFVEGFGLREIADAMEIPLGTVKSRLHHALNQLRNSPRTRKYFGNAKSPR